MSGKPQDPAQNTVDQHKSHDSSYESQQGYGVDYQDQRFQGDEVQQMPQGGRSGSYETGNTGDYGSGPGAVPPDADAQQGQGGQ